MPSDTHSTSSRRNDRMVAILAMLRDRDEVPLRDMTSALGASAARCLPSRIMSSAFSETTSAETGRMAVEARDSAVDLSQQAETLKREVDEFIVSVRAS